MQRSRHAELLHENLTFTNAFPGCTTLSSQGLWPCTALGIVRLNVAKSRGEASLYRKAPNGDGKVHESYSVVSFWRVCAFSARKLHDGELRAVCATNAMELGLDIGDLDATMHLGFAGSIASLWQQAGRAGRRGQHSLAIYVAFDGPLDQYFMMHPQVIRAEHNPVPA